LESPAVASRPLQPQIILNPTGLRVLGGIATGRSAERIEVRVRYFESV